ncbi:hypothetical protein DFH28DRAFT_349082 [Melampsora americana]|nr:hypothetical protein DFH28DRAFT_349082 [Melampsora americana]
MLSFLNCERMGVMVLMVLFGVSIVSTYPFDKTRVESLASTPNVEHPNEVPSGKHSTDSSRDQNSNEFHFKSNHSGRASTYAKTPGFGGDNYDGNWSPWQ